MKYKKKTKENANIEDIINTLNKTLSKEQINLSNLLIDKKLDSALALIKKTNINLNYNFFLFPSIQNFNSCVHYDIFSLIKKLDDNTDIETLFDAIIDRNIVDFIPISYNSSGFVYFLQNPKYAVKFINFILSSGKTAAINLLAITSLLLYLQKNNQANLCDIGNNYKENSSLNKEENDESYLFYILNKTHFNITNFSLKCTDLLMSTLFRHKDYRNILYVINNMVNFKFQLHYIPNISSLIEETTNQDERQKLNNILNKILNHKTTLNFIKNKSEFFKIMYLDGWMSSYIKSKITETIINNIEFLGDKRIKNIEKKTIAYLVRCKRKIESKNYFRKLKKHGNLVSKKNKNSNFYSRNEGNLKFYIESYQEKARLQKALNYRAANNINISNNHNKTHSNANMLKNAPYNNKTYIKTYGHKI